MSHEVYHGLVRECGKLQEARQRPCCPPMGVYAPLFSVPALAPDPTLVSGVPSSGLFFCSRNAIVLAAKYELSCCDACLPKRPNVFSVIVFVRSTTRFKLAVTRRCQVRAKVARQHTIFSRQDGMCELSCSSRQSVQLPVTPYCI